MTDLCVTTSEPMQVLGMAVAEDVAHHAPDWRWPQAYLPIRVDDVVFVTAESSTSETGLEDQVSWAAVVLWQERLKQRPVATRHPRTALGRRLLELRAKIIASGERLLDWDEIEHEVQERRGEAYGSEG